MLEGGGFEVSPDDLTNHAVTVTNIADEVAVALQAAQAVEFDSQAYGLFCQALPAMMLPIEEIIQSALRGEGESLTDSGQRLRKAADNYRSTDAEMSQRLDGPK